MKNQQGPVQRRDQFDRVEVSALKIGPRPGCARDGRHDHGVEDVENELIEDLRDVDGTAV